MKIGQGFDVHKLVAGRSLVLGGVTIPFEKGLLGHSDADVLVHAICDALLGAAALGDIGKHFPDSDPEFKDADSIMLLKKTGEMLQKKGLTAGNIDSTVIAQAPRIAPHIPGMIENISKALEIEPDKVNIKATTTEGLGFEGRGEGISAISIVLLDE